MIRNFKGRRSIRLPEYNYAQPGAYFVTICTYHQEPLFGQVVDGKMALNAYGEIVRACWREIPDHFPHVELDAFVVMPNHVHGIIWIVDHVGARHARAKNVGATHASPLQGPRGPTSGSLGAILGSFKSAVTRRINVVRGTPGARVWQRNYWEHIIRNEQALSLIRQYIAQNPLRWHLDRYNLEKEGIDPMAQEIWRAINKLAGGILP